MDERVRTRFRGIKKFFSERSYVSSSYCQSKAVNQRRRVWLCDRSRVTTICQRVMATACIFYEIVIRTTA